ncbi:MAG: bifunctional nuclease family protein, partial [Opitutales bacterium]|nr:bifunctional nuclease family protein [Opitutales bacterium]
PRKRAFKITGRMNADWIKPKGFHFFDLADSTAIFVVCPQKTFVMQTESGTGERLQRVEAGKRADRPQTHELLADTCKALGARVAGIALTDVKDGVYFSAISLDMKNELGEKFVELEARPSDALALAFSCRAPVLVSKNLLQKCKDASELLEKFRRRDPSVFS